MSQTPLPTPQIRVSDQVTGNGWHDLGRYGYHYLGNDPDLVAVDPESHVVILVGQVRREYTDFLAGKEPSGASFLAFAAQRVKPIQENIMPIVQTECAREDATFQMHL